MTVEPEQCDMQGHTVLVTGATGGIGYETARALARSGAQVIITGRDAGRGERAATAIQRESAQGAVTFLQADHSTVGGNQHLADQVRSAFPSLDVLINNAGGLYETRWETADGYEATLVMNFVGPSTLTASCSPSLRPTSPRGASTWCPPPSGYTRVTRSRMSSRGEASSAPSPTGRPSCSTPCSLWPWPGGLHRSRSR